MKNFKLCKKIELTETQKGIYFDCQLEDPIAYNLSATFLLENINEKYFKQAFKLLVSEQEALRSCLEIKNDFPILVVHEQIKFKLPIQDISTEPHQEEYINSLIENDIKHVFELTKAPLFRGKLLKLDNSKHLFFICIHHLISDGLSLNILINKLLVFYRELLNKNTITLNKDTGFVKFIEQENYNLMLNKYDKEKEFWSQKLKGIEPLSLQSDYSVKQKNGMGKEMRFPIPMDLAEAIQRVSLDQEVTIFNFFLATFGVLISQYVQSEDIIINSPFSYRPDFDYEETIGCFIRMLPLRFNILQQECFSDVLQIVSKEFINAYKNIKYPNNLIIRDKLSSLPLTSASYLFDVTFVYDAYEEVTKDDLVATLMDQDVVTFPGSLMVVLSKVSNRYWIKIQYKPDIFADKTIEMLGDRYLTLLKKLVSNVNIKVQDICLFLKNEKEKILDEFNQSKFFSYHPQNLIDLFSAKVREHPDQIALIQGNKKETYAEVNAKVELLARRITKLKCKVNECIGIQLNRSIDLIISILAVLKAGCAYVAIEPSYPMTRKEFILKDADINLLITSSHLPSEFEHDVKFIFMDDAGIYQNVEDVTFDILNPHNLAYIAYTSGSTGNPKGVMIENHSVVNVLLDLDRRFPIKKGDVFLFKTPYSFDLSVSEIFSWFIGGGALFILEPEGEKNSQLILDEIAKHRITHMNFVPSMFRLFLELLEEEHNLVKINSLKWIFIGGEKVTMNILDKFNALNTNIRLESMYGPTECTLWSTHYATKDFTKGINIPIGRPLNETRCYVIGNNNQLQPIGIPGELCLSGVGLARGYMNLQKMTNEKFVVNPFFREGIDPEYFRRMYRTGDLVRWLPCGKLDFLGRIDFQVKMRGLRLELEEIENILGKYEEIIQAIVVVKKEVNKSDILCAYYLSEYEISEVSLKSYLVNILPTYMIPSFFIHKKEWPLTSNGKVDRKFLNADTSYQKKLPVHSMPKTDLEVAIISTWKEVLSVDNLDLDDNFFEVGGHSLSLIQLQNKLRKKMGLDIPIHLLFQLPTVRLLAEHFSKNKIDSVVDRKNLFSRPEKVIYQDIAIIGMSLNVPGAENIHNFWNNLIHVRECLHFYQDDELKKLGIPHEVLNDPHYVKVRGRVEGIEYFDPAFFDYTPSEINMMSPQLRLLYQGLWEAFEDAGYFPNSSSSTIGLFLGGSDEFEWYKKFLMSPGNYVDKYQAFTLSSKHFLATRLAYKMDIKGPAVSALTACSTTLTTTHLACQSLILGESDLAIAGGITVELPNEGGYFYQPGMMFSPDGHCRPFDAKAEGTVFSNGFGLVVLKRLDEALKDGDHIYAVIKGSAMNNDGEQKLGFTAPSVKGQTEAIQAAYRVAGIDPETISYVEAHGTGTLLGDPVEVESLTQAFATSQRQYCILGSVKGNIGHTDTAAGVVGLLKVALSLKHKYLPGTVNFEHPNPKINFKNTPFIVKPEGTKWEKGKENKLLRAGINAFGVGGTNVHMVLEEAPTLRASDEATSYNLLVFSAKSLSSLSATSKDILEFIHKNQKINLSDVAWTLQVGRKPFKYRKFLVIDKNFFHTSLDTLLTQLSQAVVQEAKIRIGEKSVLPINYFQNLSELEYEKFLQEIGQMWCLGADIDWYALKGSSVRNRLSLPTYVFDKVHFPIDIATESFIDSVDNGLKKTVDNQNQGRIERIVIESYQAVLGFDTIDRDQDFFALGGDSLKAISLASAISHQLNVKVDIKDIFQHSSSSALARYLDGASQKKQSYSIVTPAAPSDNYPLSAAQSRMYTLYLLDQKSVAYNLPSATLIKGPLNQERLKQAFKKLVARHEILRTVFVERENQFVQLILSDYEIPIRYSESVIATEHEMKQLIYRFIKPFDFEQGPPFRAELVKMGPDSYLLLFDIHHIIADGTSMEIITRDFNKLYFGELPLPSIHYKDFAVWQNNFIESEEMKKQESFWLNTLSGELPILELPTDFKRPAIQTFEGDRVYFILDKGLTSQLIYLSQETGSTLFMLFLSIWNVFIARYSNQEDIIVGVPVSGRTRKGIEETIGMFVNMLPMRSQPENRKKFIDFLCEVKTNVLNSFKNQDYQFDKLIKKLNVKRDMSRNALFDVCFNFENMKFYELEIEGVNFTPYSFGTKSTVYDLTLTLSEDKKQNVISGYIEYSTRLFQRETIERMVANFQQMLNSIVADKEIFIEDIDLISSGEKQLLCEKFNKTKLSFNNNFLIQGMFEQNAKDFPDKIALIVSSGKSMSYAELNNKANALAWHLIELGVKKETIVGVMTSRDESLIIAILGILKAGCAYLPIDPEYPAERISHMFSQANVAYLICPKQYRNKIDFNGYILNVEGCESVQNNPVLDSDHSSATLLSYVIFTSGSTGNPKGVMIQHSSVINAIQEVKNKEFFKHKEDRMICLTTVSFDIFLFETLIPLCIGNSVYLASEIEQKDPVLVSKKIIDHKVTHLFSTVSRLKAFVENYDFEPALKQLTCIFSGGEHFPFQLLKYLQNNTRAKIYNLYGPTEVTIWSTSKDLTHAEAINIGQPITNIQAYVINSGGKLQPIGVFGELCLAGHGVARGYLNDIDAMHAKFIRLSHLSPAILYKTGDRARFLGNGELEISDRLDTQVKVRGYRIEMKEIENVVLQHQDIRQAVVTTFEDKNQNKQLALFYCLKEINVPSNNNHIWLKNWLEEKLPYYMVPAFFVLLDEMPLLPNGKINKKSLSLPIEQPSLIKKPDFSMSELENILLSFWREQLNVEIIGIKDNFFDLGGNSLGLIYINNKLNKWLGRKIPLLQLFEYPTIESLAKSLGANSQDVIATKELQDEIYKPTDIAVIGLSCKFPGAENIDKFWDNILSGKETISQFNDEELLKSGISQELLDNPNYKKAKGFLENIEYFDARFFNYSDQEANMMDPQIRILHQCAWGALEDAGYDSFDYEGKIGLFAGSSTNILWIKQWIKNQEDHLDVFETITLNEKDFLTTRLSYKLNLKGPSINIQTACSTSLVAIHQAVQSLINGESDMAIAGGVSVSYPRKEGYLWHEGMIFSQDGHCRPFSENASGIIPGNGCGLVLLKKLSEAIRDQDHIYAIIKGSAMNNDGIEKVGYTAPSIHGQRTVIDAALKKSGISAEDICYLETHGTATKIGDPIEIEALKTAWKTHKKNFCAIGSVKANVGHLDAAAGAASFIKTTLLLHRRAIPPHINFSKPNPLLDLEDSAFYIPTKAKPILDETVIRAGVSSFGIGGTNVHMILEQSPMLKAQHDDVEAVNLLLFSAKSRTALEKTSNEVLNYLCQNPSINLSDAAWTLQVGRKAFEYRKALVVVGPLDQNKNELIDFLKSAEKNISDIKKSDLIQLENQFVDLLSTRNQMDSVSFNKKIGELWCKGLNIDWNKFHKNKMRKRISLPTYVFDKTPYHHDVVFTDLPKVSTAIEAVDIHARLAAIWSQIFGCTIHAQDDFFVLGGDSLKAVFLAAQVQKNMGIKITLAEIFEYSVFERMVNYLNSYATHLEPFQIQPIKKQPFYETSSAQKRQYVLHQLSDNSTPYNLGAVYLVEGIIQKNKIKKVIDTLVQRHEAFRTRFSIIDQEIVQIVEDQVESILEFEDATEDEIENKITTFIKPFDLSKAPLFKVKLITLSSRRHILLIDMHHIIADQGSISILIREFKSLYSGQILLPLTLQYKDFSAWQNALLESIENKNQIEYWKNEFKGEIPILNMPADFSRPCNQTFNGERLIFELDCNINNKVDLLSKQYSSTPYMIFVAAFKLVLWKYSGQHDLVIGSAIAGRRHADLHSIVGMFANTLAIRTQVNTKLTIEKYLQYIKEKIIKAYDNQDCQFEHLIELLHIEKNPSRHPLFDVAINYTDVENHELVLDGLSIKPWPTPKVYSKFDIVWNIEKNESGYYSDIEFNPFIYKRETIESLSKRLLNVLLLILEQPELKLNELSLLSAFEKKHILYDLNKTSTEYPKHQTLIQLFEEQVEKRENHPAIIFDNTVWSYLQLNNEANRIANILTKYNVKPGDTVAIMLERCPLQMACILGILKLGCVYVPIDPDYPIERISFILEDSHAKALLTYSQWNVSTSVPTILLDLEEIQLPFFFIQTEIIKPTDTAYIIYTSGSTGKPKGVLVSHQNVIRLVKETNYIKIQPEDRVLRLLNYAFDGSVFDIFGALLNGACLIMVSKEATFEMSLLIELIKQKNVTIICITTAQFNMLVDWDVTSFKSIRKIIFAGEAASLSHTKKALNFLGPNKLIHGYGPTEAAVLATYYPIDQLDKDISTIPIGYPLANTKLYILDNNGQPVADNIPGELYIGGDAVAKGYLNQEKLTQQKFLNDPFDVKGKIYRTGDIVKRLSNNAIVFIGRFDSQVKIRGFRVELSEIEYQIKAISGIKDVVVTAKKDQHGDSYIAAYYTVSHGEISADEIRSLLSNKLPEYLVPAYIKTIQSLPLDANGKVDHKKLPNIDEPQSHFHGVINKAADIIINEMRKILNNNIGITDDFFNYGGTSIKAITLSHALSKLGITLKVGEIFQYRTVENLTKLPQFITLNKQEINNSVIQYITLHEQQIEGLTNHIVSTCQFFAKSITLTSVTNSFSLSPLQILHSKQDPMFSVFFSEIEGDICEIDIRKRLAKIIYDNQLLHSAIQLPDSESEENKSLQGDALKWKEYDIAAILPLVLKNIPYFDICELDQKTHELILSQVITHLLRSLNRKDSLPWRFCCLRLNQEKHVVIWVFDHILFDGMSAEVLQNQILKNSQSIQKYQDYVFQLKRGPQNITENEIIKIFSLNKWQEKNYFLMQKITQLENNNQKEISITIPLIKDDNRSPWLIAFEMVVQVLRDRLDIDEIPLAIVHYGRSYQDQSYYNCVGEFLDIIPVLINEINKETVVAHLLEKCQQYAINFISLLVDPDLSNQYTKIRNILVSSFKTEGDAQQLVLFNFQGYVSKKEKHLFENSLKEMQRKNLAKILITASYDKDDLTINIEGFPANAFAALRATTEMTLIDN